MCCTAWQIWSARRSKHPCEASEFQYQRAASIRLHNLRIHSIEAGLGMVQKKCLFPRLAQVTQDWVQCHLGAGGCKLSSHNLKTRSVSILAASQHASQALHVLTCPHNAMSAPYKSEQTRTRPAILGKQRFFTVNMNVRCPAFLCPLANGKGCCSCEVPKGNACAK